MCGSLRQEDRCNLLLGCISKEDILYIIGCENGKHMKDAITKEILKKISNLVSKDDVQRMMSKELVMRLESAQMHTMPFMDC